MCEILHIKKNNPRSTQALPGPVRPGPGEKTNGYRYFIRKRREDQAAREPVENPSNFLAVTAAAMSLAVSGVTSREPVSSKGDCP